MLTGDSRATAEAVAKGLGIDEVIAEVLPDQKLAAIERLEKEGRKVAMAGDGVNDAPALARARVGIAMGTGTDVAMESAGVTLVKGDLGGIVRARRLSHATMRNIRQNLFWAFAYNAAGVPIAAGILYPWTGWLLSPMLAAAAMSFSSVTVITNALRLRRARPLTAGGRAVDRLGARHASPREASQRPALCSCWVLPSRRVGRSLRRAPGSPMRCSSTAAALPGREGSLRIAGDRIVAVAFAPERLAPLPGEVVIDAHGLALAPGFIDTHTHGDEQIFEHPEALAAVSQGITTLVGGQDGDSIVPLGDLFARLERAPAAVNVASYAGHGALRSRVLGADFRRVATAAEIEAMRALLRQEMAAGALGLSTGLEYDPGIYSAPSEVVELAKVAAAAGGRYISHVRSEDRDFWAAIDEILAIGREAKLPVQISHIKLAMRSLWGQAPRLLALLDEARQSGVDVTADIYPYLYWHSGLTVLFPERNFESLEAAEFALREVAPPEGLHRGALPARAFLCRQDPGGDRPGARRAAGADPDRAHPDGRDDEGARDARGSRTSSRPAWWRATSSSCLAWPETNLCTDGQLDGRHPQRLRLVSASAGPLRARTQGAHARAGGAQGDRARR